MRWLIAGCEGFIGRNLTQRLGELQHEVYGMDLRRGHDICDPDVFRAMGHRQEQPYDVIVNLASYASPVEYKRHSWETITANVLGVGNLLHFAEQQDALLIQVSTVRVTENESHLGPNGCYVEGKRAAETLCMEHTRNFGTKTCILRLASVYGPGMRLNDGRVIPSMIRKAIDNEDIIVYGTGEQLDYFSYIHDVVNAIVLLKFAAGTPVNETTVTTIGPAEPVTINKLVWEVIQETGSLSKVRRVPYEHRRVRELSPDIVTSTPLSFGLQHTVTDMRERKNNILPARYRGMQNADTTQWTEGMRNAAIDLTDFHGVRGVS